MKNQLLYVFLLVGLISFPSQMIFGQLKNISYEYAEIYYFNTDFPLKERPQHYLVKDGIYATSKIGNGIRVNERFIDNLNQILSRGVDELYTGLSKTFVPKTGLIFYDSLDQPVATLSICTDCEGLRWWPENIIDAKRVKKMNLKKAEKQIQDLKDLLKTEVFVFDRQEDFHNFADTSSTLKNTSQMDIKANMVQPILKEEVLEVDINKWMLNDEELKKDSIGKITHGGDEFFFKELRTKTLKSKFLFSDVDDSSYLIDATIIDPFIQLPNGMQVGMSQNHFFEKLGVIIEMPEQGLPKKINVSDGFHRYEFSFEKNTLQKIKIW